MDFSFDVLRHLFFAKLHAHKIAQSIHHARTAPTLSLPSLPGGIDRSLQLRLQSTVAELHHYLAALIKSSSTRLPSIAVVVVAAKGVVASLVAVVWVVPFRSLHVHRSAYPFHPRARDLKYTYRFLRTHMKELEER